MLPWKEPEALPGEAREALASCLVLPTGGPAGLGILVTPHGDSPPTSAGTHCPPHARHVCGWLLGDGKTQPSRHPLGALSLVPAPHLDLAPSSGQLWVLAGPPPHPYNWQGHPLWGVRSIRGRR